MNADLGVIGLGVMGSSLARNFHSRGRTVAVYNREADMLADFEQNHGDERFSAHDDLPLVRRGSSSPPGPRDDDHHAGKPVDMVIDSLLPHLSPGDIIVDGGNSHFDDTERRVARLAEQEIRFVGMGVSGGEEGALKGPSMMPGGDAEAWATIEPIMTEAAAVADTGPCVTWCGTGGAGHFVKMVHNGIEYGDMQLIAETWTLLRALGHPPATIRDVFRSFDAGRLKSFLIEITAGIVAARDPQGDGPLVDQVLDVAGQKGTGRWTAIDAVEGGIALSTIVAAVEARALSAKRDDRRAVADKIGFTEPRIDGLSVEDLEQALYAAKIMSYTQGFAMLSARSQERGYGTDLAEVARIWKAGCIIRAAFLDRVHAAFREQPDLPLLALDDSFAEEIRAALPAWRKVVSTAMAAGIPVPALAGSLSYLDTLRTPRGSAALIQAQRDWFGAHTYRRLDAPDVPVHTGWPDLPSV